VAEALLGRYLRPGEVVHHVDRDTANDDAANLAVMGRRDHARLHAHDVGRRYASGEAQGQSKLTAIAVRRIRDLAPNATREELARMFLVSKSTIGKIVRRESWRQV
jgi:hypothetical protein